VTGRLVHTGQVLLDLVMRVPAPPPVGGDVFASASSLQPGGGFNVMAAAARAGARVLYAGGHGEGELGDAVRAALAAEGIEVAFRASRGRDTGVSVAMVDDSGERTFVTAPGAESELDPAELAGVAVTGADIVYLSGYSLVVKEKRDALLDWLDLVSAAAGAGAGPTVLADPGPLVADIAPESWARLIARVDVLSCNTREARLLSAVPDPGAAAAELAKRVRPGAAVLVRDGAAGCWLARAGAGEELIPGIPVTVVDSNGAGDAHSGVLAAELLRGMDLRGAVVRANAAAALAVTRPGPATAPTRAEVDALLAAQSPADSAGSVAP
jgi:sugar/nucleoside kinase (ribokinase family)